MQILKSRAATAAIAAPVLILVAARPGAGDAIDAFVAAEMSRQRIPGLSLAVVRRGVLAKAKGYGLANVELSVPATPRTVYQSGSLGKQFTAAAVMMLVEKGALSLEDRIGRFLPEAPETWRDITVRHLLTHTSGMGDYTEKIDLRRDYTPEELLGFAAAQPLEFTPGERWSYSNTGYMVLGILIQRVAGQFYGDMLRDRVFKPLGMDTARVISEADIVPNRAAGYRLVDGVLKNQDWVAPSLNTTADGALYFSVLDMAKWDAALRTERLLRRASLEQIFTPVRLADGSVYRGKDGAGYGFGWAIGEQAGHRRIEHGGSWQGFESHIARYVDDGVTVIVLANLADCDPGLIGHGVAGLVVPALKAPVTSRRSEPPN